MKKVLILMLGLLAGSASFANTPEASKPSATASLIGNDKVQLIIAPENTNARLSLQDKNGRILYSSNVNLRHGMQQQFDISRLDVGQYQFTIAIGKERTVKTFTVTEVPRHQLITLQN